MLFPILILFLFSALSLDFLQPSVLILNDWCLSQIPNGVLTGELENREIFSALLCGKRLDLESPARSLLSASGLIHLTVVSGAHLIFLAKMGESFPSFRFKNMGVGFFLIFYSLMTGLYPPVLRALISFFLFRLNGRFKLFWSPPSRVMMSGLLCLALNPEWISSLSLQMSWAAALAFSWARYNKLLSCLLCYLILSPIISQWQTLHPMSVILNWMIFPLMSVFLFPLSVLSFLASPLYILSDGAWALLLYFLKTLSPLMHQPLFYIPPLSLSAVWLYIASIFFVFQSLWIIIQRAKR